MQQNYFSFRYTGFVVSLRCSSRDVHQWIGKVLAGQGGNKTP